MDATRSTKQQIQSHLPRFAAFEIMELVDNLFSKAHFYGTLVLDITQLLYNMPQAELTTLANMTQRTPVRNAN